VMYSRMRVIARSRGRVYVAHFASRSVEDGVSRRLMLGLLCVVLGCGGGAATGAAPDESATVPEAAVRNFMQAVADSNITRMARFWGTSKGPAAITGQPADYRDRLVVAQAFLRRSPFRLVRTDMVPTQNDRRAVLVEFERTDSDGKQCTKQVPFTVLPAGKHGWIVVAIDLNQVGSPGRACTPAQASP